MHYTQKLTCKWSELFPRTSVMQCSSSSSSTICAAIYNVVEFFHSFTFLSPDGGTATADEKCVKINFSKSECWCWVESSCAGCVISSNYYRYNTQQIRFRAQFLSISIYLCATSAANHNSPLSLSPSLSPHLYCWHLGCCSSFKHLFPQYHWVECMTHSSAEAQEFDVDARLRATGRMAQETRKIELRRTYCIEMCACTRITRYIAFVLMI